MLQHMGDVTADIMVITDLYMRIHSTTAMSTTTPLSTRGGIPADITDMGDMADTAVTAVTADTADTGDTGDTDIEPSNQDSYGHAPENLSGVFCLALGFSVLTREYFDFVSARTCP